VNSENTLFLLAKRKPVLIMGSGGQFISGMWELDEALCELKYVSLHESKSSRAYRGGEILEIREVTDEEIENHQLRIADDGAAEMKRVSGRMIVRFQMIKGWSYLWPKNLQSYQMAHQAAGFLSVDI
jgi:hypothetical protein